MSHVISAIRSILQFIIKMLRGSTNVSESKLRAYRYSKKPHIISESEIQFLHVLEEVIDSERYRICPQLHLDTVLNHKISGQDWRAARSRIKQKSLDFVICDRISLAPILAIELDDSTHRRSRNAQSDAFKNDVLESCGIPLLRFKHFYSLEDVSLKVGSVLESQS